MARLTYDSNCEDEELPALEVIARRAKERRTATASKEPPRGADNENASKQDKTSQGDIGNATTPASRSKGTPLRRRKLGNPQALDGSLFQKWADDGSRKVSKETAIEGASKTRVSRMRIRETREKSSDIAQVSLAADSMNNSFEDGIVPGRRHQSQATAQESRSAQSKPLEKAIKRSTSMKAKDEAADPKRIVEVAPIIADKPESSSEESSESESEFVTALSLATDSDSSFSDLDATPPAERLRSTSAPRLKTVRLLPPAKQPTKKEACSTTPTNEPIHRTGKPGNPDKGLVTPQTPPRKTTKNESKNCKGANLEDAFDKLRIYAREMDESDDEKPDTKPDLCPITPKKTLVLSPEKAPRIPMSPWKPEHKEFWDPEVQNKWIDQHSPAKPSRTKPVAGTKDIKVNLKEKYGTSPKKRDAKKTFDQTKDALAQRFLHELDERITAGKLTKLTASTGGIRTQWSTSLQSTAGRAHWKCKEVVTMTQLPDGSVSSVQERQHHAFIELASKVLTTEDNLLNTVAHEFCHLATFMLDGKPKFAHGAEFKAWGKKCMDVFGDRGVVVTTKHSYEIDYKYIWRCVECTTEVHRHSKSVDPVKQRCGRCRGSLEQVKPVPRGGGQGKKSAYQEFVSKEMKVLKAEGQKLSFKDMMTTVASRWKTRQQEGKGPSPELETKEVEKKFEKLTVVDIVSD